MSLSSILDYFGNQRSLSGIQDWAQAQSEAGKLDPVIADLAQKSPRVFEGVFPDILNKMQEGSALSQLFPQKAQEPQAPQYSAFSDGRNGDLAPALGVPQNIPSADYAPAAPQQSQGPTALQRMTQVLPYLPPALQTVVGQQLMMGGIDGGAGMPDSAYIKAVANYQKAPPPASISTRNPVLGMAINNAILAENPDYDEHIYKERQKVANDFTPGGNVGKKLVAAETAINHLSMAQEASDKLGGVDAGPLSPYINPAINWSKSQSPALQDYNRFAKQGADEVAAFTDSNTIPGMESQEKLLNINNSPPARTAAIQAAIQTMYGKLQPEVDAYNRTYGTNKSVADFMSPETQKSLEKLGMRVVGNTEVPQANALSQIAQPQEASPAPALQQVAPQMNLQEAARAELARRKRGR